MSLSGNNLCTHFGRALSSPENLLIVDVVPQKSDDKIYLLFLFLTVESPDNEK